MRNTFYYLCRNRLISMKPAQHIDGSLPLFSAGMKMADIINANPHLLALLSRFRITCDFGDMVILLACRKAGVDGDTFLMLCNVYTFPGYVPSSTLLAGANVADVVRYLRSSHAYYTGTAVAALEKDIEVLLEPCSASQRAAVWRFFADYRRELEKHFDYEETEVFPYVDRLVAGERSGEYSIARFEENHGNIEEKLDDLKNIVMKYLPSACDDDQRVRVLMEIFGLEMDLMRHTDIENSVLIPMVGRIEAK